MPVVTNMGGAGPSEFFRTVCDVLSIRDRHTLSTPKLISDLQSPNKFIRFVKITNRTFALAESKPNPIDVAAGQI
jgi:hypothetical protein